MKRILTVALLSCSTLALATEGGMDVKTDTKKETKVGKDKSMAKVESKTTHDPDGMMNSTTNSQKVQNETKKVPGGGTESITEKAVEHDAPGGKHDVDHKTKHKVTRDAAGNVTKDEVAPKH